MKNIQYWLAELDRYGNLTLTDGAHSTRAGADQAHYLLTRLGMAKDRKFMVAKVELTEVKLNKAGVNENSLNILNGIGLK